MCKEFSGSVRPEEANGYLYLGVVWDMVPVATCGSSLTLDCSLVKVMGTQYRRITCINNGKCCRNGKSTQTVM